MNKVSIYCPYCRQRTSLDPAPVEVTQPFEATRYVGAFWNAAPGFVWWMGVCNYCMHPVLVLNDGATIYPNPLPEPTDMSVPEDIRADLDEAKQCFTLSAWRAVAVMARRAMQSAALDQGATKDKLSEQISELAKRGKITADLSEWANAVRYVGNDAAHPGGEPVTEDDAKAVLDLAEQFLHVLYVTPSIAKKLLAKKAK
jgi:hypothetical protein